MIKDLDKSLGRIKYDKRLCDVQWAIPEKSPGIFRFVILPLETPGKIKLHPWKFRKRLMKVCICWIINLLNALQDQLTGFYIRATLAFNGLILLFLAIVFW